MTGVHKIATTCPRKTEQRSTIFLAPAGEPTTWCKHGFLFQAQNLVCSYNKLPSPGHGELCPLYAWCFIQEMLPAACARSKREDPVECTISEHKKEGLRFWLAKGQDKAEIALFSCSMWNPSM